MLIVVLNAIVVFVVIRVVDFIALVMIVVEAVAC